MFAEQIDLTALSAAIGGGAINARLTTKSAAPSYLQYLYRPSSSTATHSTLLMSTVSSCASRSSTTACSRWRSRGRLRASGRRSSDSVRSTSRTPELERRAETIARRIFERFAAVVKRGRTTFLSEDYLVVSITGLAAPTTAEDLLAARGSGIAQLVRGERQPLSRQERDEIMSNRLSYLADDLVVPTWNAAFVYDTEPGVQAALEIFEFANSQLLEFRYYDELLDVELTRIYATVEEPPRLAFLSGRGLRRGPATCTRSSSTSTSSPTAPRTR